MTIGKAIRKARRDREYSIKRLSEEAGVAYVTLLNWEHERVFPNLIPLIDVADVLNISLDELIGRERKGADDEN